MNKKGKLTSSKFFINKSQRVYDMFEVGIVFYHERVYFNP